MTVSTHPAMRRLVRRMQTDGPDSATGCGNSGHHQSDAVLESNLPGHADLVQTHESIVAAHEQLRSFCRLHGIEVAS